MSILTAPEISSIDTASQDPEMMRLHAERDGLDKEIVAQRRRRNQLRQNIATYEESLSNVPKVEFELLGLTRGYDQLREEYDDMKLKQTQVELAVTVEQQQRAGRFGIVESPRVPSQPVVPNRPALIFLGLLFGVGLALAISAILESADKTIRDDQDIRENWGGPAIVAIPQIRNAADNFRKNFLLTTYWAAMVVIVSFATMSVVNAPI